MSIRCHSPFFPPRDPPNTGLAPVLPRCEPGMRIGLFGGTFNPPHEGHRLASLIALNRLRLSSVWWMVTPGNPLKENSGLPSMAQRMAAAQCVADHPAISITGFEADISTRFTYDTIRYLRRRHPKVQFVWIMGADNLTGFHRWQRWREIAAMIPIVVVDRPDSTLVSAGSRAANYLDRYRVPEIHAPLFPEIAAPAFMFLHGPRSDLSSTKLRANGQGLSSILSAGLETV